MTSEPRGAYHRELQRLDISVAGLIGLVPEAIQSSTDLLLAETDSGAEELVRWRRLVSDLYREVEQTIEVVVARQSPVAGDLRFLLVCIRTVPVLHEVIDLATDIAGSSHRAIGSSLPPRLTRLLRQISLICAAAWTSVGEAWSLRDPDLSGTVRALIDDASEVRASFSAELGSGVVDLPLALEMAVVARTFDRLGHHAGRVITLAEAMSPPTSSSHSNGPEAAEGQ